MLRGHRAADLDHLSRTDPERLVALRFALFAEALAPDYRHWQQWQNTEFRRDMSGEEKLHLNRQKTAAAKQIPLIRRVLFLDGHLGDE